MTSVSTFDGTADSFQSLASSLDGTTEKETLVVDKHQIKGEIKRMDLEQGLYLVYWKLDLLEDHVFINNGSESIKTLYFLTYFFEAQFESISAYNGKELRCKYYDPCTTLFSNKLDMKYVYKAGRNINCLCLVFSDTWLKEQIKAGPGYDKIVKTIITHPETVHVFTPSSTEQMLSLSLTKEISRNSSRLSLKAYTYNLLNSFIDCIISADNVPARQYPYVELAIEIEKKIRASLTGTLPGADQLASEFYISSSTLKRQFKQIYGKNIYQYYLEQKMRLAKEILESSKMNVTNVATALGYENVSHFIALFKKHFGSSPYEVYKSKHRK